ncbi:hypothetical protein [Pseudoduganella namucuonensis]|uniref:HEAT repeat domain-containing protein n=1 Tax=Pseudoduganella namucuonensis TaxID=1035707 RepID=A0A1I7LC88_9BURK|nr:hypothetical protein [Pseudoduganella namucuonensis]SFV07166.1 hypothetical protein SAMN05216552_102663 [Pseudoduganella namucuonensis]
MKEFITALALATSCVSVAAAPREAAPFGFKEARQQFMACLSGDGKTCEAAIEKFNALAAGHPGHPLLAAYAGAGTAILGRDAYMPWNKLKYAEDGADAVEKALAQLTPAHDEALFHGTPESVETRMLAATTLLSLPDFMNRSASGKRALEAALKSSVFGQAAPPVRARLLALAARTAKAEQRGDDEAAYLKQIVALAPQAPEAARASSRLKELGL